MASFPRFARLICTDEELNRTVELVQAGSNPGSSYFTLLVLSTLIAAYGLISNSTATVIGAMIVAPLMGPILGLGLGMVRNDSKIFYRALIAEVVGILVVILTGALVAVLVGTDNVDYYSREIAARTRPTLYDMAIGLAAGLAGAYCTVHPTLHGSVAGVAIAVALVPPLTVTGITAAGALAGLVPWSLAVGSFMLFLANLLTIEAASMAIFLMAGLGHLHAIVQRKRALAIKALLFLATAIFLSQQLGQLYQERLALGYSRTALRQSLAQIPGANLDDLTVEVRGQELQVNAVVGSRQEISPSLVGQAEELLQKKMTEKLPGLKVSLVVRRLQSTYVSSSGLLFEPPKGFGLSQEQLRLQAVESLLRRILQSHPPAELESFQELRQEGSRRFYKVTVVNAYPLAPRLVAQIEQRLNELSRDNELLRGQELKLLVQTLVARSATAEQDVDFSPPDTLTPEEHAAVALESRLHFLLQELVAEEASNQLLEAHIRSHPPEEGQQRQVDAKIVVQGPELLSPTQVRRWETALETRLAEEELPGVVHLKVESRLGAIIERSQLEEEEQRRLVRERLLEALQQQVDSVAGAYLSGVPEITVRQQASETLVTIRAVVVSPKALAKPTVKQWQARLLQAERKHQPAVRLELSVDNRLGSRL